MADFDNRLMRGAATGAATIDAGLRAYMLRVYNYMLVGLVVTGFASMATYLASVTADPAAAAATLPNGVMLTHIGTLLFTSPLRWVVMLSPLAVVLLIRYRLQTMTVASAVLAFAAFAGLMGVSMGSIFVVFTQTSIAQVFFINAAAFGGLSLYGYTTQRDLTGMGSFLIMGVWGLFIAMIVNMFLHSSMLMWVVSVAGVGIFAALTAYDTQAIKNMYYVGDDGSVAGRKAVMGALRLYLDFINMFMFLLNLMGNRR